MFDDKDKDLRLEDKDLGFEDKDSRFENMVKDKDLVIDDKDKDLQISPRGLSSRTTTLSVTPVFWSKPSRCN